MTRARPSMVDVAKKAGVSQRTVSNVLGNYPHVSERTRRLVLQAVEDLDYRPNIAARRLRLGKTGTLALAVPNLSWSYFGEISHLVQKSVAAAGYKLLVAETEGSAHHEAKVLRDLHANLIDGMLLSPIELTASELDDLNIDSPLVLLGERISDSRYPHFAMDNIGAARQVTRHLYDQGARRFLLLGATQTTATSSAGVLRQQGFELELAELGLQKQQVRWEHADVSPWTSAGAYETVKSWLRTNPLPDAIIALNDLLAFGTLRALREAGVRVPDDVLLSGWDDTSESQFSTPTITTIAPDKHALVQGAVDGLIALIEGTASIEGDVLVDHTLQVRESTKSL
ncbi:LacI family DNA-binding transcriptional regulator [Actinomyces minihominis]|uniref:LacI family DNA-binding transcriptional regulator n=1 Tax=Actinomyces minihominis TaxID=2002838 RepID=UPI001F5E0677|nr:LacI family DNA-binding transcriptional regulator [Actinomyces minihominis]